MHYTDWLNQLHGVLSDFQSLMVLALWRCEIAGDTWVLARNSGYYSSFICTRQTAWYGLFCRNNILKAQKSNWKSEVYVKAQQASNRRARQTLWECSIRQGNTSRTLCFLGDLLLFVSWYLIADIAVSYIYMLHIYMLSWLCTKAVENACPIVHRIQNILRPVVMEGFRVVEFLRPFSKLGY